MHTTLLKRCGNTLLIAAALSMLIAVAPAQDPACIESLRDMGKAFSSIAGRASPAVVGIKAEKVYVQEQSYPDWFFEDPFEDFFERHFGQPRRDRRREQPKQKFKQRAQGSGFLISSDGYILTNNHLVGEAETVKVKLRDNETEIEAKVIGADPESDVAVVRIDRENLPFLELADSDTIEVGEWVMAIGSPFGFSHTVTAGIVSAKGRSDVGITTYEDFIQTDAAINPGNSGGPLLNLDGKAVGINTAIISQSGGNMGIGLAIPVNMAKAIYEQLMEDGKVVRGYLGVDIAEVTPELAEAWELKDANGAVLSKIHEDSPAEKAGLKHNDIIIQLEDKDVEGAKQLQRHVATFKPDTEVKVVVLRDGKKKTFTVRLGERPSKEQMLADTDDKVPASVEEIGILEVRELSDELASRLGYKGLEGVVVVRVRRGSPAEEKGIAPGMVIMEVNREIVHNKKDFYSEIKKVNKGETVVLLVTDGRHRWYVPLRVPEE